MKGGEVAEWAEALLERENKGTANDPRFAPRPGQSSFNYQHPNSRTANIVLNILYRLIPILYDSQDALLQPSTCHLMYTSTLSLHPCYLQLIITHLVLVSGKLVLQKKTTFLKKIVWLTLSLQLIVFEILLMNLHQKGI